MSTASSSPQFDWEDPFQLAGQLSDEERMVEETARRYCQDRLAPRVRDAFRHETTDPAIFREMGELGLLGATIPEAYGGAGLNYVSYGLIAREVERVDSGYRSMMSVQSSLVMLPIFTFGSEAQKLKYLPGLASGELIERADRRRLRRLGQDRRRHHSRLRPRQGHEGSDSPRDPRQDRAARLHHRRDRPG